MNRSKKPSDTAWLEEKERAEDIILGSLGFDNDVSLISLRTKAEGFSGKAKFSDGTEIDIENDGELTDLERWALGILTIG